MNWFPQIGAGSIAQFPLRRVRRWRSITNMLECGEQIVLPDPGAGQIEWRLAYQDLSDSEVEGLQELFSASKGSYGAFGFVDPLANLLAWSEDLSRPDWQPGSLSVAGSINDPLGGHGAWSLSNGSPGALSLTQSVGLPGSYILCFSAWIRSDSPSTVTLLRDGVQSNIAAGSAWKRAFVSGRGTNGAASSTLSISVAPGQTAQVFGLQAEAQPYPSQYKPSTAGSGIYEETYFASDELTITSTAPGLSQCEMTLLSRV
ncbi:MAG TPA: hypothetical protein VHB50_08890 [Bryobacteraceae bacterium]|nr:hypothetical protein [Bryobacteraceae bacterium]